MAVVHSPAIKPHQHVAGREHEDDHRHEHEDDGLRLSVAAERLIEGPLNMHVPPTFIIAIAPSKQYRLFVACAISMAKGRRRIALVVVMPDRRRRSTTRRRSSLMPSRSSSTWKRAGSRATRAAAHPGGLERGGHGGGDEPARLTVFPHAQSTGRRDLAQAHKGNGVFGVFCLGFWCFWCVF